MRLLFGFASIAIFLISCDEHRVYEKNIDLNSRYWLVDEHPAFEFDITDTLSSYNLYCNIRNSIDYPYANIYLTYYLTDSTGALLQEKQVSQWLFDKKTGEPFGESGLGDLYDHRIPLMSGYRFDASGTYKVSLKHYMRKDTLDGVLAVGLRVERTPAMD